MDEPVAQPHLKKPAPRAMSRVVSWFAATLIILFLVMMLTGPGLFEPLFVLVIGWVSFLKRTVPAISWNWDLIGMAVVSSAIILFIAHWFLRWLTSSIATTRGASWKWRWKWTWCGLLALALCFLVGMAIVGIVHQAGWMASSPESWLEEKGRRLQNIRAGADMRQLELGVYISYSEASGDLDKMRALLNDRDNGYVRWGPAEAPLLQRYQVLLIPGDKESQLGLIIFPRVVQSPSSSRGIYKVGDHGGRFLLQELDDLIQKHGTNLVAL